eukprot:TRINITY_DN669_c0_g1_i17.p1 TRINITY_DN669_c0_g1~~TRINITY_DN669_c0_g1_i17.p1  ORF type:complete len:986 (+),score=196.55 TRINITY_DN669_c0_g1_i17:511-3468(+)
METPSANIFDPSVYGSRATLEESRASLSKWVHLWAATNSVMVLNEEREQSIHRTMTNVPGRVMFEHMNLSEGDIYGLPSISLWFRERRWCPGREGDNPSKEYSNQKVTNGASKGCWLTEEEFEEKGISWKGSLRKSFPLFHSSSGEDVCSQLLTKEEFEEISKKRPFYTDGKKLFTHEAISNSKLCSNDSFTGTIKADGHYREVSWKDPVCVNESVFANDPPTRSRQVIRLIATGKMKATSISSLLSKEEAGDHFQPDVMLGALETFVVEKVDLQRDDNQMTLTIKLVSRGSLFTTDRELRTWCRTVRSELDKGENCLIKGKETKCPAIRNSEGGNLKTVGSQLHSTSIDSSFIYFSSATQRLSSGERKNLVDDIGDILRRVNEFSWLKVGADDYFKNHGAIEAPFIVPYTTRPSYAFLRRLGRIDNGEDSELPHIPEIGLSAEEALGDNTNRMISISADTIAEVHKEAGIKDEHFESVAAAHPEVRDFDLKKMYGEEVFEISMDEIKQLIKSTKVTTSSLFPRKFYTELVARYSGREEFQLFFNVFRTTPLLNFVDEECWGECIASQKKIIEDQIALSETKIKKSKATLNNPDTSDDEKKNSRRMKYLNEIILKINEKYLTLWEDNQIETLRNEIKGFVERIERKPKKYGFKNQRHAKLILGKALTELSTEVCVSQKGYFFTSGRDGKHNHICKKTDRSIVFLASPGLDFCYPQPTMLEAPKYFTRVADPDDPNKTGGWKMFQPGKRTELHQRLKVLYTCIFKAAQKQDVRNMSMLPLGLGVFTENLMLELKHDLMKIYFKVQFELLAEHDWGFENYYINAQQHTEEARRILNKGLEEGGDYNNETDCLHLRCNVIFHNKDAKFLATELARLGKAPSFLNPSDSQAVMQGFLGMYWEKGRSFNYVGEEDWAATSTGVLASFKVTSKILQLEEKDNYHDDDETSSYISGSSKGRGLNKKELEHHILNQAASSKTKTFADSPKTLT